LLGRFRSNWPTFDKSFWMSSISLIQDVLSLGPNFVDMPIMNDRRCHQAQTRVMMLMVVPGDESTRPVTGMV